jgi:hypothetical protein
MEHRVSRRYENGNVDMRGQGVGEGEHPLEMTQPDSGTAIRREQSAQGHDVDAPVAAQAWIRWSAVTTSS